MFAGFSLEVIFFGSGCFFVDTVEPAVMDKTYIWVMFNIQINFNPFHFAVFFLYPLEASENLLETSDRIFDSILIVTNPDINGP